MNKKGVTLIELLVVIIILGTISGFAISAFSDLQNRTNIKADTHNINVLNSVTQRYVDFNGVVGNDAFTGYDTDESRMTLLVTEKFLNHVPTPAQSGATYEWDISTQTWGIVGGETDGSSVTASLSYDFSTDTKATLIDSGAVFRDETKWTDDGGVLENVPGEQRLFIPISNFEYTISVNAQLSAGSSGGYGIFFDTKLANDDPSKDEGYIFQFDRGYGNGAMIIRPRSNGRESGPVWVVRDYETDVFPSKRNDPDGWWTSSHTVKIVVQSISETERQATFFIDGSSIGSYTYTDDTDGEQLYTGFRTWSSPTTKFQNVIIN